MKLYYIKEGMSETVANADRFSVNLNSSDYDFRTYLLWKFFLFSFIKKKTVLEF